MERLDRSRTRSFSGTLRLGVISDARVMPEPDLLVAGFEQELRELEGQLPSGPAR